MIKLGINLDHIATVREARKTTEPSPVLAVHHAELGGADSITVHLREDERHIKFRDVQLIREIVHTKLNLEMAINVDVIKKALQILPDQVTLVPEKRQEITTESGLDCLANKEQLKNTIASFKAKGIIVSLFIDPELDQIRLSKELGADFVELHTGAYANTKTEKEAHFEFEKIRVAGELCTELGLGLNAGHGLTFTNIFPFLALPNLHEVNIGHSIISRAVFTGLTKAVSDMKAILSLGK